MLKDANALEKVWLTLVALFILEKAFKAREDEWMLIAKKAKACLKKQGIVKPEKIINALAIQFSLWFIKIPF